MRIITTFRSCLLRSTFENTFLEGLQESDRFSIKAYRGAHKDATLIILARYGRSLTKAKEECNSVTITSRSTCYYSHKPKTSTTQSKNNTMMDIEKRPSCIYYSSLSKRSSSSNHSSSKQEVRKPGKSSQQFAALYQQKPTQPVIKNKSRSYYGDYMYRCICRRYGHMIEKCSVVPPKGGAVVKQQMVNNIASRPESNPPVHYKRGPQPNY